MIIKNRTLSHLAKWHTAQVQNHKEVERQENLANPYRFRTELDSFTATLKDVQKLDQGEADQNQEPGSVRVSRRNPHFGNLVETKVLEQSENGFLIRDEQTLLHRLPGGGPSLPETSYTHYQTDTEKNTVAVKRKTGSDGRLEEFTLDLDRQVMLIADDRR